MDTESKQSQLELIIQCEKNLLDLLHEGVLSTETVIEYIQLLDDKFFEIIKFLNTDN